MRPYIASLILASAPLLVNAQQVRPANSEKIYHEIAQMRHLAKVLYVAAHPDDENTRLLSWLVNEKHIRTAYLSLTRGDGGQNILGSEQGEALGLIRTHELMEARKIDGAEQFFSRAIDFGFSKNYDETFKHWDKDSLVNDAVWVMRQYRPDVVICRFPPNKDAGHGQHAASAIVAAEAFKAAGDRTKYTWQLPYYDVWQPKRILWNTYKFGSFNTTSEDQFKMQVGDYVPSLGMGTGELAGISRTVHKSQGAGTPSIPGAQTEYFKLVDGDHVANGLFDGIDISWGRVGRKDINDDLKMILNEFNYNHPDASILPLLAVRAKINSVKDNFWREEKLKEMDQVILDCAGFMAELYTKQPESVAGATLPFTLNAIARSRTPVILESVNFGNGFDTVFHKDISKDSLYTYTHSVTLPSDAPLTEPYWLSLPIANAGAFAMPSHQVLGMTETPNHLTISAVLIIGGVRFPVTIPISSKKLDPVKGDVVEGMRVVPGASVSFSSNLLLTNGDGSLNFTVKVHTFKALVDAPLYISNNGGVVTKVPHLNLAAGTDTTLNLHVTAKELGASVGKEVIIYAGLVDNLTTYVKTQTLIQYSHLPTLQYFKPAVAKVLNKDWKCSARRIGYVEGAGDFVLPFLRLAGLEVDVLKDADMADASHLRKYDVILTGIRSVNVEKKMAAWLPVLFKYAENGGTLVMQYNTTQDMATTKIGPYPMTLANDQRVTEEDAKITLLEPTSSLLNYPNNITEADFSNWVQERGLYFAAKFDDKYTPLFAMNDAGEQPLKGGTLYTRLGKGMYIYTSLSFFRQLPAGNKGAIKLLMNFLSAGKGSSSQKTTTGSKPLATNTLKPSTKPTVVGKTRALVPTKPKAQAAAKTPKK